MDIVRRSLKIIGMFSIFSTLILETNAAYNESYRGNITDCGPVNSSITEGVIELLEPDKTEFGAVAIVRCNSGYEAVPLTISCTSSGEWSDASCEPIDCGDPPDVQHGTVTLTDILDTSYEAEATLECEIGYNASSAKFFCDETGYWESVTCLIVDCGPVAHNITKGEILLIDPDKNTTVGAIASVRCDEGYEPVPMTINCTLSGYWEEASCEPVDCGVLGDIKNGVITLVNPSNTSFAAEATIICNPGYNAKVTTLYCGEDGMWDNSTCSLVDCGDPVDIENGMVTLMNLSNTSFAAEATITCNPGYNASVTKLYCGEDGNWNNASCSIIDCGQVSYKLTNGEVVLIGEDENTTVGAIAIVRCEEGYEPVPMTINCTLSGYWERASCDPVDCGDPFHIENGMITLFDPSNTSLAAEAILTCKPGYNASVTKLYCGTDGNWDNASCSIADCGDFTKIEKCVIANGLNSTVFGAIANVICDHGFTADKSSIICLMTGIWENVTCFREGCDVDTLPTIANGQIIIDTHEMTYSTVNVTCNNGYAPTSKVLACQGHGQWQNNISCLVYDLGSVKVETGQEIHNDQHSGFFKCAFTVVDGLKYRIKWFVNTLEIYDTGVITSTEATSSLLTDDMFSDVVTEYVPLSEFFNSQVKCSAAVYDGAGETEYQTITSIELIPLQVSTYSITMMRGKQATFTVYLNFPFGCSTNTQDCTLRFIVYDPNDSYHCYDSSIAVIHSDTCGGKIIGATPATISHVSTANTFTNITITTKNNRWYRLRRSFSLVLKLSAVGNSKTMWNSPSTSISVTVTENNYTKYRGCYSFVDPYIYTFDRRWYSNQLLEEFVLFRHKSLPIEVQTITAGCNRWATCSCAVTVRAGGDVFTINHCFGHLTTFLSAKDNILKVYKLWSTYYRIILPTGMNVYVYVMSYFNYMMNVYVVPTPSDFEQMEGLCGNFNGYYWDDTILRGTTQSDQVESYYGWWWWWSNYFFPHQFAYSWGLVLTGRQDESLLNPDVYENVESWDNDKKLCVCPYANTQNDYDAMCSADEEAICTGYIWYWGRRIRAQTRNKRDVNDGQTNSINFEADIKKRLKKMKKNWEISREKHTLLRKKRQVNNTTAIPIEDAEQMCEEQLNSTCNTYSKKDDVSDVAESNDTLGNCARDTAISGTTEWVTAHCDALTQKVTVEIEKDLDFADNNTDLVEDIKENACPSNCSGHGQCVNQTCVCFQDFGTDLCLLNLTTGPLIEELADEGICDVSNGNECSFILIVGNGFVESAKCYLAVYVAGPDGNFNMTDEFQMNCTYTNYNELYAQVPEITNLSNDTNATIIARMVGISVSNDGINFGPKQTVVVLDTTCQERQTDSDNETIVTLKSGFCYIAGRCHTAGTYLNGSSCAKCDTSQNLFVWTDGCDNQDDTNKSYLIIIGSCIGGVILVAAVVLAGFIYHHMKAKKAGSVVPMTKMSLGPSKMKFWYRKDSNVGVVEHHLGTNHGKKPFAANYFDDDDSFSHFPKEMTSN